MDNVVEKIRKLLAKATSQNEHEAQAALLKARELMAKHKISERDVGDAKPANRKLTKVTFEEKTYSPDTNTWFPALGGVIAEAHCCACITWVTKVSVRRYIQFTGLGDDPIIALEIFRYAVYHIQDRVKAQRKVINYQYGKQVMRNLVRMRFERSYADGFIQGLKRQYDEQMIQENNECECMSLVMVMPKEVTDFVSGLESDTLKIKRVGSDSSAFAEGEEAGYKFKLTKQITEGQEAEV